MDGENFHILLTTYSFFERDSESQQNDRAFFRRIDWEYMVLDEVRGPSIESASFLLFFERFLV